MNNNIVAAVLAAWVLFQVWRGLKQGFWSAVFSLLGVAVGYLVTFFWGASISEVVASMGFESERRALLVYPLTFIVVSAAIRNLPLMLFPVLRKRTKGLALGGGFFGMISGVFSGLIAIWFVNIVWATAVNPTVKLEIESVEHNPEVLPIVTDVASSFVASGTKVGMTLAGFEKTDASVASNLVKQPTQVFTKLQHIMRSDEMRALMQSSHTQRMMATNDVGSLKSSREFRNLTALPAMDEISQILSGGAGSDASSDEFLAKQLSFIWRRMHYLKNDPRVLNILNDEDVQRHLSQKNFGALFMNTKFQRLVALVMDRQQDMPEVKFTELAETDFASEESMDAEWVSEKYQPQEVYKWEDEHGSVRYSDFDQIPKAHLESAQKLVK